jgi:hypothetical protein
VMQVVVYLGSLQVFGGDFFVVVLHWVFVAVIRWLLLPFTQRGGAGLGIAVLVRWLGFPGFRV